MDTEPLWRQAADFGFPAFLLLVIVIGGGYAFIKVSKAAWELSNKFVDSTSESIQKQARACSDTARAVEEISACAQAIHKFAEGTAEKMLDVHGKVEDLQINTRRHGRALGFVSAALKETTDNRRAHDLLEQARDLIEKD